MTTMPYHLIQGDSRQVLTTLPDQSIHCIVTSPPYYGLRDYGVDGQIGSEEGLSEYLAAIRTVFRHCWRVLRDDGTFWLNLGDSYANDTKWGGVTGGKHASGLHGTAAIGRRRTNTGLPSKCLMGVPWRVAFALVDDGWVLRSDIIWCKPNPLPESVTDRPTKAHEYLFLLSKGPRYYYDAEAISEPASPDYDNRSFTTERFAAGRSRLSPIGTKKRQNVARRNKRSVWSVPTHPYPDAHFATFPPDLIEPCILAGTSAHGVCRQCAAPW